MSCAWNLNLNLWTRGTSNWVRAEFHNLSTTDILSLFSRSVMSDSLWPHGLLPTRFLCPWDSPGKNTGVGCYFFLQGIFPTQESNQGLLPCGWILYQLRHQGSPKCTLSSLTLNHSLLQGAVLRRVPGLYSPGDRNTLLMWQPAVSPDIAHCPLGAKASSLLPHPSFHFF